MRRRYAFLTEDAVQEALDMVRDGLLAAKSGEDVDTIMGGILTFDERMKVGRRIQVAKCLRAGLTRDEIREQLHVGLATIAHVANRLDKYERCFELIGERRKKVDHEYREKKYVAVGGSTKVFKSRKPTDFIIRKVKR